MTKTELKKALDKLKMTYDHQHPNYAVENLTVDSEELYEDVLLLLAIVDNLNEEIDNLKIELSFTQERLNDIMDPSNYDRIERD